MKVEYINPFIVSMQTIWETMLNCSISRKSLALKRHHCPGHDVSGVIGLSGAASGTVVLSLSRDTAISCAEAMLGYRPQEIDAEVKDVVGELVNMVAGAAKSQLEQLAMTLAIPTVITGKFSVDFPGSTPPIQIVFECPWGELTLEVGLVEHEHPAAASATPCAAQA